MDICGPSQQHRTTLSKVDIDLYSNQVSESSCTEFSMFLHDVLRNKSIDKNSTDLYNQKKNTKKNKRNVGEVERKPALSSTWRVSSCRGAGIKKFMEQRK